MDVSFKGIISKEEEDITNITPEQCINYLNQKNGGFRRQRKLEIINGTLEDVSKESENKRNQVRTYSWFKKKKLREINDTEVRSKQKILDDKAEVIKLDNQNAEVALEDAEKLPEKLASRDNSASLERRKINEPVEGLKGTLKNLKGFDKIAGYEYEKNIFRQVFIKKIEREKKGEDVNVPGSVLMFGPTGNGKTTITNAFAEESGCEIVPVEIDGSLQKELQEKEFFENLKEEAENAQKRFENDGVRTVIFVDEIDKVANKEYIDKETRKKVPKSTILNELETFLATCSKKYHCTVFTATNNPLNIGLDLDKKENFSIIISIDPPKKQNAIQVLKHYLKDRSTDNVNFEVLAQAVSDKKDGTLSIAQIQNICESSFDSKKDKLTQEDILKEIKSAKPIISKTQLEQFQEETRRLIKN